MLRDLREKAGLTQIELARKLGFSTAQYISNCERQLCQISTKHYAKLSKILKVSPEVFIDDRLARLEKKLNKVFKIKSRQ